jgi:hypothetical protein
VENTSVLSSRVFSSKCIKEDLWRRIEPQFKDGSRSEEEEEREREEDDSE